MKSLTTFLNESRTAYNGVTYGAKFQLTNRVVDFMAARNYLVEDDMTEFLKDYLEREHAELAEKVVHIEWVLNDRENGVIYLVVTEKLDNKDLDIISDWVRGECSDGLGGGFEQQDFAAYYDENTGYYDEDHIATFDWKTNKYKFKYLGDAKSFRYIQKMR